MMAEGGRWNKTFTLSRTEPKIKIVNLTGKPQTILLTGPTFSGGIIIISECFISEICFCHALKIANRKTTKFVNRYSEYCLSYGLNNPAILNSSQPVDIRKTEEPKKNHFIIHPNWELTLVELAKIASALHFEENILKSTLPISLSETVTRDNRPVLVTYQQWMFSRYRNSFFTHSSFICKLHHGMVGPGSDEPGSVAHLAALDRRPQYEWAARN